MIRPSRSSLTRYVGLLHVILCAQYGTVSFRLFVVNGDFTKFTLKSSTVQCPVQCALKVVVTREKTSKAMAEWLIFDAAFSDVGGIPSANFFRLQHLV